MDYVIAPYHRFNAAWAEVNQRIGSRTQFNISHIVVIAAITAAFISAPPADRWLPALFMPIVSCIFVAWYRHNEGIIGVLSLYCGYYEKLDWEAGHHDIPAWFSGSHPTEDQRRSGKINIQYYALNYRKWSDRATALICIVSPICLIVDMSQKVLLKKEMMFTFSDLWEILGLLWCLIISFILAYIVLGLPILRQNIIRGTYDKENGLWNKNTDHPV